MTLRDVTDKLRKTPTVKVHIKTIDECMSHIFDCSLTQCEEILQHTISNWTASANHFQRVADGKDDLNTGEQQSWRSFEALNLREVRPDVWAREIELPYELRKLKEYESAQKAFHALVALYNKQKKAKAASEG